MVQDANQNVNIFAKKWTVYLPSSIKLDDILLDHPIEVTYNKKRPLKIRDNLAYVLGQIHSSLVNEKGCKFPSNEFTPICGKNLQKVIKNYNEYLTYAYNIGLIQNDGSYYFDNKRSSADTKCLHYKFTEEYFLNETTKWYKYTIYDSQIIKSAERLGLPLKEHKKYINLKTMFNSIEIDLTACKNTLKSIYPNSVEDQESQLDIARKLNHREMRSFSIGKTGRLYSPFSNLHKSLRKHITLDNEPLYEIDIVSSIPYMSLVLFDNERLKHSPEINRLVLNSNKYINPPMLTDSEGRIIEDKMKGWGRDSYIGGADIFHVHVGKNGHIDLIPNIKLYKSMVLNGTLYQFLADSWNRDSKINKVYDRKTAKEKLLSILNSPSTFDSHERRSLANFFPDVIEVIDLLNRGYFKTKKGVGKAKKTDKDIDCPFAKFTQGLEAHIVLDLVSNEIANNEPFVKLITLHDAIYVKKQDILLVKNTLESKAKETTGYKLNVRVKNVLTGKELNSEDLMDLQIEDMEHKFNYGLSRSKAKDSEYLPF